MKPRARTGLWIAATLTWAFSFAPASDTRLTVSERARALHPGEVVSLLLESSRELQSVEAVVFDRSFPFFPETKNRWRGLVGIDLSTKPGRHLVRLLALLPGGQTVQTEHSLEVEDKTFPTRHLTVDEKFVSPPPEVQGRIQRESRKVAAIFATLTPQRLWSGEFESPVPGAATSGFGKRSVFNGRPRSPHSGTDFSASTGTPVRAPNSGTVVLADELYFSGNTVILDHGLGLYSYFGHLSAFSVKAGDRVQSGEILGRVGATGRVTGPHLHWSVRLRETRVDPLSLMAVAAADS